MSKITNNGLAQDALQLYKYVNSGRQSRVMGLAGQAERYRRLLFIILLILLTAQLGLSCCQFRTYVSTRGSEV